MSPIPKQKMCWQCEGNVGFNEDNCPYCGVYLHPDEIQTPKDDDHTFSPPYRLPIADEQHEQEKEEAAVIAPCTQSSFADFLKPLLTILLGSTLSIFAIILYLFNHNGVFTLQWNADIWYAYLIVSLPLLWYGWRSMPAADSSEE